MKRKHFRIPFVLLAAGCDYVHTYNYAAMLSAASKTAPPNATAFNMYSERPQMLYTPLQ